MCKCLAIALATRNQVTFTISANVSIEASMCKSHLRWGPTLVRLTRWEPQRFISYSRD